MKNVPATSQKQIDAAYQLAQARYADFQIDIPALEAALAADRAAGDPPPPGILLAEAFPDNLAKRRDASGDRGADDQRADLREREGLDRRSSSARGAGPGQAASVNAGSRSVGAGNGAA